MAGKSDTNVAETDLFGEPWVEPKDPRGRKRHKRCAQVAEIIAKSRADGLPIEQIELRTGLSAPTLRKYYFRELDNGQAIIRAGIVSAVFDKALTGNAASAKLALAILEKGDAAVPVARAPRAAPAAPPPGKKALAEAEAHTAHEGTEWGDLLRH